MKYVFDIETDGLDYTKIWILSLLNIETMELQSYSDHDDSIPDLAEGIQVMTDSAMLIGHNIISFDLPALEEITDWRPDGQKLIDTLLLSQLNKFHRFSSKSHAMKAWGNEMGQNKQVHEDWSQYSQDMRSRCESDVMLNFEIYKVLLREIKWIKSESPDYAQAIRLEHETALECAEMTSTGWRLDIPRAKQVLKDILKRMAEIELEVEPRLPQKRIWIDPEPRKPKWLKDGRLDRITAEWLGIARENVDPSIVPEEYQRYKDVVADLGNSEQVTELLLSLGWKPTEWNWGFRDGQFFKKSPKLTEDSLDTIEDDLGKLVAEWRMLRSRRGFVSGLLDGVRSDDRIECDPSVIGTHTSRMRHRGIVNVPGARQPWGREVRELFIAKDGYKLIGCDSASNQLRGFAHYLDDPAFTDVALHGDLHDHNSKILGVNRSEAKIFLYAALFGAGDKKLGGGSVAKGKELRKLFNDGVPNYKALLDNLDMQWEANGGFIWGLDGRPVWCERHKCLNNLLQVFEAVTMKSTMVMMMNELRAAKLDAKLVIIYHDEVQLEVREDHVEEALKIVSRCFEEAPKKYGCNIMSGDARSGDNWYEVH